MDGMPRSVTAGIVCETCNSGDLAPFWWWFADTRLESGGDDPSTCDCELDRLLPVAERLPSDAGVANHLCIDDDVVPVQSELLCGSYSRHSTGSVSTNTGLLSPLARSCTHTQANIPLCTHTHTHTYTHTHTHTHTHEQRCAAHYSVRSSYVTVSVEEEVHLVGCAQ